MKKVKKALMTLLPSFFVLAMTGCNASNGSASLVQDLGEDAPEVSTNLEHAKLDRPNFIKGDGDDEEEEVSVVVDKVILHYYNEDGGNAGRAFYLWVTGQDGAEYNLDNAKDIMKVNEDGTMMTIELDFKNDSRFEKFANKSRLFFIIKYKKISDTNLNWGGQSDDMQLVYTEFPPKEGSTTCEAWTMPAAGGGIAILDSENKTKVHGVQLAKFSDWNTISCQLTKDTTKVNWSLYAFDESYYRIKPKKRDAAKKNYLVLEGSATAPNGTFTIPFKYKAHVNLVYSLVSHDPTTDSDPDMAQLSKTVTVGYDKLYETEYFHTHYEKANKNAKLGMTYSPSGTTFKVWSPVSANMSVMLYDVDTTSEFLPEGATDEEKKAADKGTGYYMHYTSGGIWELTIDGDLKGKYYNLQVDNTLGTNITMDPYATSAGACGVRGYIYDEADSNPDGWANVPDVWDGKEGYDISSPKDLAIYEVHMQDFTGDESWVSSKSPATKRGTYEAFVEENTKVPGTSITSGFDHLKDMGVNAVQLVPVFDSDNDESTPELKYNWGYNPLNYNIPEGGYSSDPHNGLARVKEFKNMVMKLSETPKHTRVVMDVVYNHVSSATGSNFHKLMPRYYFRYAKMDHYNERGERYQQAGELWDGSGCHNEVASERPMMRKFIVDSLVHWAKDYKIKGFRFDLMGLIDFKTLIEAKEALYAIDKDIYMYGEGWCLGYHGEGSNQWKAENPGAADPLNFGGETWQIYNECNNFKTSGVYLGGFNNAFRDAMRGDNGNENAEGKVYPNSGWLQNGNWKSGYDGWYVDYGALNSIAKGMWGWNTNAGTDGHYYPEQTVNYVSCHDNWTLRDQLFNTLPKRDDTHPVDAHLLMRTSLQAHAMVMASNTPAFMLGGEELFRTKELTADDIELPYIIPGKWTEIWGHYISHDSYNCPLHVNSFKWGNKVKVQIHDQELVNATDHYIEDFQRVVASHYTTLKKDGNNTGDEQFLNSTSAGKPLLGIYWSEEGNFSNCTAFQVNETFIYTCTGNIGEGDYIQCKDTELDTWPLLFDAGDMSHHDNRCYFGARNSISVYDRHGN